MEPIKELEGKKIAIIGLGASQIDYVIGKENSVEWDEVWVINSALSVFDCDRVFMLDPASRFLDTDDAGNTTVAYALAFAAWNKVGEIDLFGMDFSYKNNLHFAEAGRACLEFWICKMIAIGIKVGVSPRSSLLDQNVDLQDRLYGYHRLPNPKVAMPNPEGEWVVCNRSELAQMVKKHNLETVELPSSPEPYKG